MIKHLTRKIMMQKIKASKKTNLIKKIGVNIGQGCEVYQDVSFGSEPYLITIGNNVRITKGVSFVTHDGGIWTLRKMNLLENADLFGKIAIGNNVHIGFNVIIMPGVTIGDNCIIGCGAVVTKNIPSNSVAVGVPARVIKSIDEYYEKSKNNCDYTKNMNKNDKRRYLIDKYGLSNT